MTPPAHLVLALAPNGPNIAPSWDQKPPKWTPKPFQNRAQIGPRGGQDGEQTEEKRQRNIKMGSVDSAPLFYPKKVANIAPSWVPSWSQNGEKIDAKIDQKFDASWDRFLEGFWWILGGKMEACWHLKSMKNRCHLREAIFYQSVVFPKRESKF